MWNSTIADRVRVDAGPRDVRRIEAVVADRVGERPAVRVQTTQEFLIRRAHERAAADEGDTEAHTLLFGEADDLNGKWKWLAIEEIDERDGEHDAKHAVERTGVRNGIEVRADEQPCGIGRRAWVQAAQVARIVQPDRHPASLHPGAKMRVNGAHRRREERPRCAPRLFRVFSQQTATLDDLAGLGREHHDPRYTL